MTPLCLCCGHGAVLEVQGSDGTAVKMNVKDTAIPACSDARYSSPRLSFNPFGAPF